MPPPKKVEKVGPILVAPEPVSPIVTASKKLLEAAKEGNVQRAAAALAEDAPIDSENEAGNTALLLSACNGHVEVVRLLTTSNPAPKINAKCKIFGWTALMYAARYGRSNCVRLILNAKPPPKVSEQSFLGKTALDLTDDDDIKQMLQVALLMEAAIEGRVDRVQTFLDSGVDINSITESKDTALNWACQEGRLEVVKLLLGSVPAPDIDLANIKNDTPLLTACRKGNVQIVDLLLRAEPAPNVNITNTDYETAISIAAQGNFVEVVKRLLMVDPQPLLDTQDKKGDTAFIHAATKGYHQIVQLLLRAEVPPQVDLQGNYETRNTALMCATANGHMAVVRLIMAHDPQPNIELENSKGQTALSIALTPEFKHVIKPPMVVQKIVVMCTERPAAISQVSFHYTNGSVLACGELTADAKEQEPFLFDQDEYLVKVWTASHNDSEEGDPLQEVLDAIQFETSKDGATRRSIVYGREQPKRQKDLPQCMPQRRAISDKRAIVGIERRTEDPDAEPTEAAMAPSTCPAITGIIEDDRPLGSQRTSFSSCSIS